MAAPDDSDRNLPEDELQRRYHTATRRHPPALDLVMFDFASDYAQQPEEALVQLERLVLDRNSCLDRIAFLRATAEKLRDQCPEQPSHQGQADLSAEIKLVASGRLLDAHQEGKLTPDRVRLLHRLSCDPEALWRVHQLQCWSIVSWRKNPRPPCDG